MHEFLKRLSAGDLIAVILVVGCLLLLAFKIDGEVKSILTMAAGWCFGKHAPELLRKRER